MAEYAEKEAEARKSRVNLLESRYSCVSVGNDSLVTTYPPLQVSKIEHYELGTHTQFFEGNQESAFVDSFTNSHYIVTLGYQRE